MKLHRIEATNLNSLWDTQVVDLDDDLRGASLFLVQGPTGSGKSTLMDAVSLALFGTTPRLGHLRSEQAVAEQIMSRGAGEAQAKVVFSKQEPQVGRRVRYRATWSAWRARKRPDGKVQATHRSLERQEADGTWALLVSDQRAKVFQPVFDEVLERFTAQDFQRSMLLAQGRFDALLHSAPEERAAILERLTDTAIYQRLGERAARMKAAWEGRLARLQQRCEALAVLPEEQVAEARTQRETAQVAVNVHRGVLERVKAWQAWLQGEGEHAARVGEAQARVKGVDEARQQAAEALAALAEHERCAEALAVLDERGQVQGRLAQNARERGQVEAELPGLHEAVGRGAAQAEAATGAVEAAEAALGALREPAAAALEAARAHAEAQRERDEVGRRVEEGKQAVERAQGLAVQAKEELGEARRREVQAAEAARALAGDAALVGALPELSAAATGIEEAAAALQQARQRWQAQAQALDARQQRHDADREAHRDRQARQVEPLKAESEAARAGVVTLLGEGDPDEALAGLHEARDAEGHRQRDLERARDALEARDEGRRRLQAREGTAAEAAKAKAQAEEVVAARAGEAERASAALQHAEVAIGPLERIAALGEQRGELKPGEPCPLCGSGDHPFVHDEALRVQAQRIDEEVAAARARRDAARQAQQDAQKAHAQARERLAAAGSHEAACQQQVQAMATELEGLQGRALVALGEAGCPGSSLDEVCAALARVVEQVTAGQARVREAQQALATARRAEGALARAELELRKQAERLAAEKARLQQARQDLVDEDVDLQGRAAQLEVRRRRLGEALRPFAIHAQPPEAGLVAARQRATAFEQARQAAQGAATALVQAEAAHQSRAEALQVATEALEQARGELAAREGRLQDAATRLDEATGRLRLSWQAADDAHRPRPALDEGPTALVAFQESRVQALRQAREQAVESHAAASRALAAAEARHQTLLDHAEGLAAELEQVSARLGAHLQQLELEGAPALAARRLAPEALQAATAQRAHLQRSQAQAEAHLQAVLDQQACHQAARPEDLPAELEPHTLADQLRDTEEALEASRKQIAEAEAVLARARQQSEDLQAAREALKQAGSRAEVWRRLHELIGVGDGKRFKLFAQALNLEQLLRQANHHLADLSQRYRLSPLLDPDSGLPTLDFVVEDGFRPGAPRSLSTLSGGESFLVSLALALGLSDLRSSSMPVETVLLDEGFGTLDRDTLEGALAVLQQLQLRGRQVGIISHLSALQEAIEAQVLVEPLGDGRSRVRVRMAGWQLAQV